MSAQALHDTWLVITAITIALLICVAIYLCRSFWSSRYRCFFVATGVLVASVAVELICSEIKNFYRPVQVEGDMSVLWLWLAGRVQELLVAAFVLGYYVFGRNGTTTTRTETR
jgi:predicted tellurium resistance membrane protein TerC